MKVDCIFYILHGRRAGQQA